MIHDHHKEKDNSRPQNYVSDLMKVMGVSNRHGRLIRSLPDGKIECGGIIYKDLEEFDTIQSYLMPKKKSD